MPESNYLHTDITSLILKGFFNMYNHLGFGFLEKVYENAMHIELTELGLQSFKQYPLEVFFKGSGVGKYYADLLVENKVIVELKAAEAICEEHEAQLVHYLRATELEVGLLLNFGKTPEFKRKVLTQEFKTNPKRS